MTSDRISYAVIGAGCGGQSIAGYLASRGYETSLYNRSESRIQDLMAEPRIRLRGEIEAEGKLSYAGTDMEKAVRGKDVIMVVTTADAHRELAHKMAPYMEDGQIVILNPGRTCGALDFERGLYEAGCAKDVISAEANTLVYATRVNEPGVANIKGVKKEVSLAALRNDDTKTVLSAITSAYPQFVAAESFLDTSLGNIGAIFHPTITLMNRDRIMKGEEFDFYTDGVDYKVAEFIEEVDREFRNVSEAFDANPLPVTEWLMSRYGIPQSDVYTMLHSNRFYNGIKAPKTIDVRYLWEDIPTGLVPIAEFGHSLGVDTPAIDYLIDEGSDVLNRDFRSSGRTPEKLGLSRENLKHELKNLAEKKVNAVI